MESIIPDAGQSEEAVAKLEGVSAESLRDTRGGSPPEPRGGMLFAWQSGSRPLEGYTIKRGVGRGGFGEVYYATSDAGKEVALKLVRRNLEIELRGMTQCLNLKHVNLISLYDIRQDGQEAYWVVMEYVAGESLEQVLARHPDGLPPGEAVACMKQVCAGVAYLHDRGIVHRDLKPGNIFLDEGTYKIGDYGLSKFISHSRRSGQTESIGTVHYMAPEIANGRYGKEIDTYALGVMLYEMLVGHVPYEGESIGEVLMKHLTAEPDLNRVPAPFRPIVARLLRKDPDQRYPTVPALVEDIDAALAGRPLSECATSLRDVTPRGARRHTSDPSATIAKPRRLKASSTDQVLSGVCAGFANYYGVDPLWVRLAFVAVTFAATGVPILIYFVLAFIMPSDEPEAAEEFKSASSGISIDPARMRELSLDALRVFIALFLAGGVGCMAGAIAVTLLGWHNEAVYLLPLSIGFLIASASIGWLTRSGHGVVRALCVLLFAAAVGFGVGGLAVIQEFREEEAAFLGVGSGLMTLALGLNLFFHRTTYIAWRLAASLFAGVGSGLVIAAMVLMLANAHEMAVFLGVGTGFLVCGLTAFTLFFGFLSPGRQRVRAAEALRATQVWTEEGGAGASAQASGQGAWKIPRVLIVAAVVLGLIPAALVLFYKARAANEWHPPAYWGQQVKACSVSGCNRPATVVFSKEFSAGSTLFDHKDYCETHARQGAWEAQQVGVKYAVIDIATGQPRTEFDARVTTSKE